MEFSPSLNADAVLKAQAWHGRGPAEPLIAVGASTGGTEALKRFLLPLGHDSPPVLIAQHMPETFTAPFAARLDALCVARVKEAEHGELLRRGHVYISPGHSHLLLGLNAGRYVCELSKGPPVNRHRPSVDVLFRSMANHAGKNGLGVMLTGMGRDGARGMLEMKLAGAYNFAQDEASCVVFGMPKEAIVLGAVDEILALDQLMLHVLARASQRHDGRGGLASS